LRRVLYEEVYLWEYEKRIHSSLGYITPEEFEMSGEVLNRKVS